MVGKKDLVIIALLVGIWWLLAYYNTPPNTNIEMGWMQISNRVGKAGATIYTDGKDVNLVPQMRFTEQPTPTEVISVNSLSAFINQIDECGAQVIYRHGDSLMFVKSGTVWVSFTPVFYGEGRILWP
jgi:hypothetical protein